MKQREIFEAFANTLDLQEKRRPTATLISRSLPQGLIRYTRSHQSQRLLRKDTTLWRKTR